MKFIKVILLSTLLVLSLSAREKVNVNFSDLEINDFIKLISKITNKNILINNKIKGTVNFVSTTPVYDDELIGILVSVLESKGYTMIEKGSLYEVIRSTEVAKHNVKIVGLGKKAYGSLMVTQAVRVQGANVDVVAAKIRYLISKTAKLMTMKESNTLLVTDYPKNIETIKEIIEDIVKDNMSMVEIVYIKNTEAKKLQTKIVSISKSMFNDKVIEENVKIILDENINGIIIVGKKANVAKVKKIVLRLDVESSINKVIKIFSLKNSDSKSVLKTLNDIIAKQVFSDPGLKPNITENEEINAIVVVGDPDIVKGIKVIIDELDKEKYQVYVTARIINIYKKDAEDLGVKYGFDGAAISSTGGLYTLAANLGGSAITVDTTNLNIPTNLSSGFALGAAIDFLEQNDASKAISNPSILCVNNQESSIYVGQTISIASGSTNNAVSGITNNFTREDVGLTLKIKPRVSSKDKVTLAVETILENIDSFGNPETGEQPVTSKQEVKTQVILRHAESVIIGGLVKKNDKDNVSKVPLLGDIPVVGEYLFSSKSVEEEETNLVVVLTPYVVSKSENLSKLQEQLGYVQKLQEEYNVKVFKTLENKIKETDTVDTKQIAIFDNNGSDF